MGDRNRTGGVATMEEDGAATLPTPLLEQPQGAPPLSELTADSLALVLDGPSLVRDLLGFGGVDSCFWGGGFGCVRGWSGGRREGGRETDKEQENYIPA